ncbi:IS1380-like element ISMsm12 family transposase [Tessaracoccus lubricantis]|uniref:IS1380-like element ISMsm12 family transposase n=1 Tax=Tessaracoccus lubricantis TaxID=545543 RepID=A0ABP9FRP8_9ACTN
MGGLVPVLRLAEQAGLSGLLAQRVTARTSTDPVKAVGVIAGILAGADSIDDLDILRHGAMGTVFAGVRAPSTYGTFLRSATAGTAAQLRAVNTCLLGRLAEATGMIAVEPRVTWIDIDDTIREVHGYQKQAAAYGHTRQLGLNVQLAAISSPGVAPVIAQARLRRGNTTSLNGADRMVTEAIGCARHAGVTGPVMVRADAGYYAHKVVSAALRAGAWFSITVKTNPAVERAIASIDADAWTPIRYPQAVWDPEQHRWISDAEVAEVPVFTAFTRSKSVPIGCRLIVRRVKRLNPQHQPALCEDWRYHGFITNSDLSMIEADQQHRGHAIIEQVIAELKAMALKHLPSGKYLANTAWVGYTVIAFNLARAAAHAAGRPTTRWPSLTRHLITIPARIIKSARRLWLRFPTRWAWKTQFDTLWNATGPPTPALS